MPAPVISERFGRFLLLHRFAVGGMAEIFLARTPSPPTQNQNLSRRLGQVLVIKRMRAELARDQAFVDMFIDEQRAIKRLDHPNIVRLLDCGEIDGRYYLALEHIWGESLTTLLGLCSRTGMRFPLAAALHIGVAVADALHHAHSQRGADGRPAPIIHRDVTLGNVVISYQGAVKVLDFGLAKFADRQARTGIGQIKGTLVYLAPEQVTGGDAVPATDIYQLGVLLYKLLVGCEPVAGANDMAVMQAIARNEIIRPSTVASSFPPRLETILLKALARQPIARFADAGEFAAALRELLSPPDPNASERMARVVERLCRGRYEKQLQFVRSLLEGSAAAAASDDLWRYDQPAAEPRTVQVELSAIIEEQDLRELRADSASDDPRSLIVEYSGANLPMPDAAGAFEREPTQVDKQPGEPEPGIVSEVFKSLEREELEPGALVALEDTAATNVGPSLLPVVGSVIETVPEPVDVLFDDSSGAFAPMARFDRGAQTRIAEPPRRIDAPPTLSALPPVARSLPVGSSRAADVDNVPTRVSAPGFSAADIFEAATQAPDETFASNRDGPTAIAKTPTRDAVAAPQKNSKGELEFDIDVDDAADDDDW